VARTEDVLAGAIQTLAELWTVVENSNRVQFVRVGERVVNLAHVTDVEHTDGAVVIYLVHAGGDGPNTVKVTGAEAERAWAFFQSIAPDLMDDAEPEPDDEPALGV
jgi:hypothetical protein